VSGVDIAHRCGHEDLNGLPDEFRSRVAEQLFGLFVNQLDCAFSINAHDRVGGGFQQTLELCLALRSAVTSR
jgi:hypothetical protein